MVAAAVAAAEQCYDVDGYLARHHRAVKAPEKMTKESLSVAGFVVVIDINTCRACGVSGGRGCCEAYTRSRRSNAPAIQGVEVVRR